MGKLDIKVNRSGDKTQVQMIGTIDEDIDFNQHVLSSEKNIDFDLSGIKSINSCGIREWIKWMGTMSKAQIQFMNCPKVIVDQINMVVGFLPSNAKVQSFFVPYYNEESGSEKNVLFRYGVEFKEANATTLAGFV